MTGDPLRHVLDAMERREMIVPGTAGKIVELIDAQDTSGGDDSARVRRAVDYLLNDERGRRYMLPGAIPADQHPAKLWMSLFPLTEAGLADYWRRRGPELCTGDIPDVVAVVTNDLKREGNVGLLRPDVRPGAPPTVRRLGSVVAALKARRVLGPGVTPEAVFSRWGPSLIQKSDAEAARFIAENVRHAPDFWPRPGNEPTVDLLDPLYNAPSADEDARGAQLRGDARYAVL